MFDKLVESGARGSRARTGKYFVGASLLYMFGLLAIAIATVLWFNPGMAEAFELTSRLAVPPIPVTQQPMTSAPRSANSGGGDPVRFVAPEEPAAIPNPGELLPNVVGRSNRVIGNNGNPGPGPLCFDCPIGNNVSSSPMPPPPPPPSPTPTPPPLPSPTVAQTQRVSERVLQGSAITRVTPPYPEMAKRIRVQGPVQILVTISEEGKVTDATVVSGHPLLRESAIQAARRWVFTPTRLGSVPVKVQGVLTFNFVMN